VPERSHLSIGEVLSLLREEFPDVTISKIRFLESQGLVDPERTPSGYRKFYDHDVERLRWILRQQRENFLPLKVIRGRLSEHEGGEPPVEEDAPEAGAGPGEIPTAREHPALTESSALHAGASRATNGPGSGPGPYARPEPERTEARRPNGHGRSGAPTPSLFASLHSDEPAPAPPTRSRPASEPAAPPAPAASAPGASAPGASAPVHAPAEAGYGEADTYTAEELATAAGSEAGLVQELKQYGLVAPHSVVAGVSYYDAGALAVLRAAAEFARHGVEARHLRPWRNAADREAVLFQQVVLPLLRQRNPQARQQALETLDQLTSAGAALRAALVERAIREIR
jgi:DNA-binding transcriptional MerR regulator